MFIRVASVVFVLAAGAAADAAARSAAPAARSPKPEMAVVVRQELAQPFSARDLAQIAATVKDLWRTFVDVELVTPDQSVDWPVDDTLELKLTDRETPRVIEGLGWIEFIDGEPARQITVSVARAAALADGSSWGGRPFSHWPATVRERFMIRAVAYGIAHELGHYLLRSPVHPKRGLMRAIFSVADIMDGPPPRVTASMLDAHAIAELNRRTTAYLLARRDAPASSAGNQS